jgi:hypothetical protein
LVQKQQLRRDGYLLFPGLIPRQRVDAALKRINRSLGEVGLAKDKLAEMRARSFCPEIVRAPEILDLYAATELKTAAEELIGPVRRPPEGQIALRFPQHGSGKPTPHIDGMYTPENGVRAGTLYHFTALAGVFLTDTERTDAGNFTVWPGSHDLLSAHLQEKGVDSLLKGYPKLALPEPRPIVARAGDAILAHYALAHGAGPNLSPHIRYAVFFRLFHTNHQAVGIGCVTDLWAEWEGMRALQSRE